MSMQHITFTCVPASAVSHTSRGKGQLLEYQMITGVRVGKQSVQFRHPDYEIEVDPHATATTEQFMMPPITASRILRFAQVCFVPGGPKVDGADFTMYVAGYAAVPSHRARIATPLSTRQARTVQEPAYHVIGAPDGTVVSSFLGLSGQRGLGVLGYGGTFGITKVADLMRVFGATVLGSVEHRAGAR